MASTHRTCPSCGLELELPSATPGTVFTCPECKAEIVAGIRSARPTSRPPAGRPRRGGRHPPNAGGRRRPTRNSAPAGLIAAGIVVVAVVAAALFALESSDDTGPDLTDEGASSLDTPVRTTFAEILAGKHAPGARVIFSAAIYPGSLIQISGAGAARHFTLAVPPDSDILERVRDLARRADDLLDRDLAGLEVFAENEDRLAGAYDRYDKFMEELELFLRIRDGDRAIAVEIGAFDDLAKAVEWKEVGGLFRAGPDADLPDDTAARIAEAIRSARDLDRLTGAAGIPVAEKLIEAMAEACPPDLETDLPDVDSYRPDSSDPAGVDAFNQLVDSYNSELIRRRKYQIQRMKETCLFYRTTLQGFVTDGARDLIAEVLPVQPLAAKTFDHDVAFSPEVFVREDVPPQHAFATRHYRTAAVLVSSYPTGATVEVDGASKGKAPLVLTGLLPGKDIRLGLSLDGHKPSDRAFTPRLRPNTPMWVCRLLWPTE